MNIVCFFSYKGGTGRTMLLANTAFVLAKNGLKIGCVDLDLEAAGLLYFFGISGKEMEEIRGKNNELISILKYQNPALVKTAIEVSKKYSEIKKGKLFVLPTISDPVALDSIEDTLTRKDKTQLLDKVFKEFLALFELDVILVDVRTGESFYSGYALQKSKDGLAVVCMRLDRQNAFGTKGMLNRLHDSGIHFTTVASLVFEPKEESTKNWIKYYEKEIGERFNYILPIDRRLLFGEKLAVLEFPNSAISKQINSLALDIAKRLV